MRAVNVAPALTSLVSTDVRRPCVYARPPIRLMPSSTPISRSVPFVQVHFARTGTSPVYA